MRRLVTSGLLAATYTLILRLAVPFLLLGFIWWSRRVPGYADKLHWRLGLRLSPRSPRSPRPIWIHAVSVGETLAIAGLVDMLLSRHPGVPLLLTSTTPTGAQQVARLFGHRVEHSWLPIDTPGAMGRFFDHFQPRMVLLVETEIWPNLVREAQARRVPLQLLNARLSARSARAYGRLLPLIRPTLAAFDVIAAQSRADARRFRALGGRPAAVLVVGSVKYDLDVASLLVRCQQIREQLGQWVGQRRIIVAASTHAGEETQLLSAFRKLLAHYPDALLLLAPRHPERLAALAADGTLGDLPLQYRSAGGQLAEETRLLLWDTLGELGAVMGLAELVFVGGSLVPHGGHNPLEAAVWGIPVLTGPHHFNFTASYRELLSTGAAIEVADAEDLETQLTGLLASPGDARRRGAAGKQLIDAQRGAVVRQFELVNAWLDPR